MIRALGADWKGRFTFSSFKHWKVNEHKVHRKITPTFGDRLYFYKGGAKVLQRRRSFTKGSSDDEHHKMAEETFQKRQPVPPAATDLVICDEINNAVHDGLLP